MAQAPRKGSPPPRPPSPLSATRKFVAFGEHGRLIPIGFSAVRIIYYKNWTAKSFSLSEQP